MAPTYRRERGFTLTRMLDAPPEVVWQAWTEPEYLDWFFNPGTVPSQPTTVDLRVGGAWRQHMVESAERAYMTGGIYREIVPCRRLVFAWGASGGWPDTDEANGPQVTVELTPVGARTRMDVALHLPDQLSDAEVQAWLDKGVEKGMAMTVDRLVAKLGSAS
jgi:uncharacterized protein YndB with AHSA1/START domain